jgi:DnaJ-class molecular chaperone
MPIETKLILIGIAALAIYVVFCRVFPYTVCRNCKGSGKFRSPSGKAFRNCRRCGGAGRRRRLFAGWS